MSVKLWRQASKTKIVNNALSEAYCGAIHKYATCDSEEEQQYTLKFELSSQVSSNRH
jgi:hypothetical protein